MAAHAYREEISSISFASTVTDVNLSAGSAVSEPHFAICSGPYLRWTIR